MTLIALLLSTITASSMTAVPSASSRRSAVSRCTEGGIDRRLCTAFAPFRRTKRASDSLPSAVREAFGTRIHGLRPAQARRIRASRGTVGPAMFAVPAANRICTVATFKGTVVESCPPTRYATREGAWLLATCLPTQRAQTTLVMMLVPASVTSAVIETDAGRTRTRVRRGVVATLMPREAASDRIVAIEFVHRGRRHRTTLSQSPEIVAGECEP